MRYLVKLSSLILTSMLGTTAYAYTLGEPLTNTSRNLQTKNLSNTGSQIYLQDDLHQKYKITINNQRVITKIEYSGDQPLDLKASLGKYYSEYHNAWLNRANKFNHRSSAVASKHVTVTSFGVGGDFFTETINLNNRPLS